MKQEITTIFFSCRRLNLLSRLVDAFMRSNTYPMKEVIIVNDSGDLTIHKQLKKDYPNFTLVLNPENVGLIKSIDLGYSHIATEYFFHCEDDWCCIKKGNYIEQSLAIMESNPLIEEVWLADYNKQPIEQTIYHAGTVPYRIIANWALGDVVWHGFTTACGLKRMSDYHKVSPYVDIPWVGTIWHREHAIGEEYYKLGYRTAILMKEYAINIGRKQREYITGYEK